MPSTVVSFVCNFQIIKNQPKRRKMNTQPKKNTSPSQEIASSQISRLILGDREILQQTFQRTQDGQISCIGPTMTSSHAWRQPHAHQLARANITQKQKEKGDTQDEMSQTQSTIHYPFLFSP